MTDAFSLEGKVAAVTGALGLLGREHCAALASAGARVVVCDLDGAACERFARELPGGATGVSLDVSDEASVREADRRIGRLDVLVNNAAVNDRFESPSLALEHSRFENYPVEAFRRMMDVNVTGLFLCSQVFGTRMAEAGGGSIVNIASTYGIVGPDQSIYRDRMGVQTFYKTAAYPTSKGAVLSFTRFLAAYWGERGVRVNALSPGGVENGQDESFVERYRDRTPLKRMARPDDYRAAVVFLAGDGSRYMTGANLVVDGGWTAW